MSVLHRAVLGLALAPCLAVPLPALADTPAAPAGAEEGETANVLRYVRQLERTPDTADAPAIRRALLRWTIDTPDYVVNICDMLQLPEEESPDRSPITGELNVQMMFGNAAYQIEHGKDTDELSRQVAAVESALRAYTAYVSKDPTLRAPVLDALLHSQKAGTLRAKLTPLEKACQSAEKSELSLTPEEVPPFLGGFLHESHVVYPLSVGRWSKVDEHRYDDAAYGASVRFQREDDSDGWIDVYFYPVGVLSPDGVAQMAARERDALQETWAKEITGAPMSPLATFVIPVAGRGSNPADQQPRPQAVTARAVDFAYVNKDTTYSSAMVILVDRLYAIKFRYSAEASSLSREQLRRDVEAFARLMVPQLDISSTGKCGTPTMFVDGKRADGCAGEEAIQPVVNEGQRELRFEYGNR